MPLFDKDDEGPQDPVTQSSVRLRASLWRRLDAIAGRETDLRKKSGKKPPVISRNDVVERFLEDSASTYEEREGLPKKP